MMGSSTSVHWAPARAGTRAAAMLGCALALVAATLACATAARASFGIIPGSYSTKMLNRDGTPDVQAGSHPYEFVISFAMNVDAEHKVEGNLRDADVNLPPGFVGNPTAVPQCPREEFEGQFTQCSQNTQVGLIRVNLEGIGEFESPVYNLTPPYGVATSLGLTAAGFNVIENASVRTGSDYGIEVDTNNIANDHVALVTQTVWGVPGDPAHDPNRFCQSTEGHQLIRGCASGVPPSPFLTMPTSCAKPLEAGLRVDSREAPGVLVGTEPAFTLDGAGNPAALDGCERLAFEPSLAVSPDTSFADTPAGLTANIDVGQAGLESPEGLSAADVKNTVVTLPEGVAINPGQAAGLQACPYSKDGVGTEGPPSCPSASKVGTVSIRTPLLKEELEGDVYVLPANPPNVELLVAPAAPGAGIYLKLIGHVHLDPVTGRLTTTFAETPALPFTHFRLSFSGGAQAALSTPLRCGTYTTHTDFTPWGTPFQADDLSSSSFAITAGTNGAPCPTSLGFTPSMIAGATTDQAGGFTDFSLLLTRPDDQQRISSLQFTAPEGLLGMLSKVPLCGEPQAAQGSCPAASQIGHTVVEAGPGPYPLVVPQPGAPPAPIYLTGSYRGAPFGLSIAVPVVAGPFNLGTVVVRAKVEVDPLTAQIHVATDPLPTILDGVPADLRAIDTVVDKPEFMFNPTDCGAQSFSGTATSAEGASVPLASHFQMGSCRSLTFKPDFRVSTSGKPSRANGASLDAKIIYPTGALGDNQASGQSNIAYVKVELPKQLPSRLSTLQKACTAAQFNANPAGCPAASVVGHATAITPVLPVPVSGPAYFVSYGNAKFPELVVVLQGYGVTVDLHGETFISKTGITSSTFARVPDVPITSFDLNLPQGPYSALTAIGNLCHAKLTMPTTFIGHNGARIHQSTPITPTGCSRAIAVARHAVRGRTLTVAVSVPAAGTLSAYGSGLSSARKTSGGRETLTLALTQRRAGRLATKVKLRFAPQRGKRQTKSLAIAFKR